MGEVQVACERTSIGTRFENEATANLKMDYCLKHKKNKIKPKRKYCSFITTS